jgi:hypothetical protein
VIDKQGGGLFGRGGVFRRLLLARRPFVQSAPNPALLGLRRRSTAQSGCADIVIGREDGWIEVWDVDEEGQPHKVRWLYVPAVLMSGRNPCSMLCTGLASGAVGEHSEAESFRGR